jgi:rubredoxin
VPAPYQQVDLYQMVRRKFKFHSNRLGVVCKLLGLPTKGDTGGFDLWAGCMRNDVQCWERMIEYNQNDVVITEALYQKLLPWIHNHPNHNLYSDKPVCPNCGGVHHQRRGFTPTVMRRQRYRCSDCGAWFQDRLGVHKTEVAFKGV